MPSFSKYWMREARTITSISTSVTITMFAQLLISAVETLIVARLGDEQLAGMTLALSMYLLLFLFAVGIVSAIIPIVAHAYGRGDLQELRLSGQQVLWVALAFSLLGTAILLVCGRLVTVFLGAGLGSDSAADYLLGSALGFPAWVVYVAVRCLAVATGRVRVTTVIMLTSVPVHAGLTWVLVFGGPGIPAFGVFGAGAGHTLTAIGGLALLAAILRFSSQAEFGLVFQRPFQFDPRRSLAIVRLGVPFACRIVLRKGVLPMTAFLVVPFGTAAIVAHGVAVRVISLTGVSSFGFFDAANMRVSYAIGASTPHDARRAGWIAIQLSAAVSALMSVFMIADPTTLAGWVLGNEEPASLAAAAALLPVAACLQFLEGVQAAASGALSGLRDAKFPLLVAILGGWIVGIPAGLLLARLMIEPVNGMWWGLVAGASLTTFLYLFRFHRKMICSSPLEEDAEVLQEIAKKPDTAATQAA